MTALEFEFAETKAVPGWTGRYCTQGKAFLEYYDSRGRSFQRTTSTFEVTTEENVADGVVVVDFSRKS